MRVLLQGRLSLLGLFASALLQTGAEPEPFFHTANFSRELPVNAVAAVDNRYLIPSARMASRGWNDVYLVQVPFHFAAAENPHLGEILYQEKNRLLVVRTTEAKVAALSAQLHGMGAPCGAVQRLFGNSIASKPAHAAAPVPVIPVGEVVAPVAQRVGKIQPDRIRQTVEALSSMPNRFHASEAGKQVAGWLGKQYLDVAKAAGRSDVRVEIVRHKNTPQPSLVVLIPGVGAKASERVILGSHIDSINGSDRQNGRAPGADDNASGTATNLEIFRVLMETGVQPARTIEIHGYAAEEVGLVGSQEIAKSYKAADAKVVAMLQFDMNLFTANKGPDKIWLVSNDTHPGYNEMLGKLIDVYVKIPWESLPLRGGSSDHAAWTRQGFAAAFPFENPRAYNRAIHSVDDTLANAPGISQAGAFAKLGLASTLHLAGIATKLKGAQK